MAGSLGEFELIRRYFTRPPPADGTGGGVILGVGDDAAVLRVPDGEDLVAAVDSLVEGRHFPAGSDPRSVGYRALAVNLSDLAAMGAVPRWALLALTLPAAEPAWLEPFAAGFMLAADRHGVALVGGNTTAGPLNVGVQILGTVPRGTALLRSGARPGDVVAVTGTLGDAAAGLELILHPERSRAAPDAARELVARFEYPTPRVAFGCVARGIASAAMDLSDGLAGDLAKLAAASGVGAHLAIERLPLSSALLAAWPEPQARDFALAGGEDYELLLCVRPQRYQELAQAATRCGVALTRVGEVRAGTGVSGALDGRPVQVPAGGYDHFR